MLHRRISYILLLISAAILYLFVNGTATLALLVCLLLAPWISLILLRLSGKNLSFKLEVCEESDAHLAQDAKSQPLAHASRFNLTIENGDIIPIPDLQADVVCVNLRTSENEIVPICEHLMSKQKRRLTLEVVPSHIGRYEISLRGPKIYDALGLWSKDVIAETKEYITILPEIYDMELAITSSSAAILESDRFSDFKDGSDPGEIKSIREYIPGDEVRNIHWKLSEKTGKTLIKELGLPITEQFLIVMDTATDIGLNPAALDSVASVLVSTAQAFRSKGIGFSTGWTDPATGKAIIQRVNNDADLASVIDELLAVPATSKSAFETIDRGVIDSRFAHLIFVSSRIPEGIDNITNGCQVTLLLYGEATSSRREGVSIIGFNDFSYQSDLSVLEV